MWFIPDHMSVKYAACDLDGTLLLDGAQELPKELPGVVRKLKKKGIRFIVASGRQYANERRLFGTVADDISYIAENGTLAVHQGKIIFTSTIERKTACEIIRAIRERPGAGCILSAPGKAYVAEEDKELIAYMKTKLRYDMEVTEDLCQVQEPVLKLAACCFQGAEQIAAGFQEKFGGRVKVITSGNIWLDFIAMDSSKGNALSRLLEHLGIGLEDGIALGDQENDVEMLRMAGVGCAVLKASDPALKAADVTGMTALQVLKSLTEEQRPQIVF